MMIRWLVACALFVLTAAPAAAQETPQALRAALLDAIKAGDAEAIAALYTEDAVTFTVTTMVVRGQGGVRAAWEPFLRANDVTAIDVINDRDDVLGDTAVSWGLWSMTYVPKKGGDSVTMEGRFMDMSKKRGAAWRFVVDHVSVPFSPPPEQ